jgi:hypothetical protein
MQPAPIEGEAVAGEPDRLAAVLGPKPWAPDRTASALAGQGVKPVAVGASRILAGLDQGDRGHLGQPGPLPGPLGLGDHPALDLGVAEPLPSLIGTPPFGERVVVDHPGAPKRPGQRLTLPGCRVDAIAIPDQHATEPIWPIRQDDHVICCWSATPKRCRRAVRELAEGHLRPPVATALPGANPPGVPVVPVVLRCVGAGRPIGDDQGVHPPAANSGPGRDPAL